MPLTAKCDICDYTLPARELEDVAPQPGRPVYCRRCLDVIETRDRELRAAAQAEMNAFIEGLKETEE